MKVAKWNNDLAVRLPEDVVAALKLKEGDELEIRAAGQSIVEVGRGSPEEEQKPDREELLTRLRRHRGMIPEDFKFDRDEANAR